MAKVLSGFVLAIMLLCGLLPEEGSCGTVLKIGSKYPEASLEGDSIKKVAEIVLRRSGGRLRIVPYFSESLGNADTQFENVMLGTQDMYMESYSFFQSWIPEMAVHTLPYMFKDAAEYRDFLLSPLERELEGMLLEKTGMRLVGSAKNWVRGPYRVLISSRPLLSPEDLKGLKLRMSESRMNFFFWTGMGASVTVIPWSEVYLALRQGVVDAASSTMDILYSMKFTEICRHITMTDENRQQLAFVINDRKFRSLGEELQRILDEAFNEVGDIHSSLVDGAAAESLDRMRREHGAVFHEPDLSPWRAKARSVLKVLEEEKAIPPGLVDRVEAWKASRAIQ